MNKQKSLRQLAKELEISPSYLSMILSGQRNPNADLKNKLCSLGLLTNEAGLVAHNPEVVGSNPTPATNFGNNITTNQLQITWLFLLIFFSDWLLGNNITRW